MQLGDTEEDIKAEEVWIDYTNHRGDRRWRKIRPCWLNFKMTKYHPTKQWILRAEDKQKGFRDFAMQDIHGWSTEDPPK